MTWRGARWKLLAVGLAVGMMLETAALVQAPKVGPQPIQVNRFAIEIDGLVVGHFQEVRGLDAEVEVIEYRTGSDPTTHKTAGPTNWSNIVLKQGVAENDRLWQWFESSANGEPQRKNGAVILYDKAGLEVVRYNFINAFPVKWQGPALDASKNDLAYETIEIAHEGFQRVVTAP